MAKEFGRHFPVKEDQRPRIGEAHREAGGDAVEEALLLWVACAKKEKAKKEPDERDIFAGAVIVAAAAELDLRRPQGVRDCRH